jgi:hypothetical protein
MTAPDLTEYGHMARAFLIFDMYGNDRQGVSAEHDQIWAGPNPAIVSPEHRAELDTLGWHADEPHQTFYRFT